VGGARYTRDAVESLSRVLWPYPYDKMTSVEGILGGGGMEYPMMTVMTSWADTLKLAGDLMHEVAHNWFPMEVGSDEKRWVWMDEGLTQFNTAQGMEPIYGAPREGGRPNDSEAGQRSLYLSAAGSDEAAPLMRHGDLYPRSVYFVLPYNKGAQVLSTLRELVGEDAFWEAYREYGRRWRGKHPYPWDFFRTVEDVTGRNLGWFWRTWYYETWPLDQAIASVRRDGDSLAITVEDRGLAPMPARLRITRADGYHDRVEVPVDVWLEGATRHVVRVHPDPPVVRVEIDPEEHFPDVDRSNQVWRREGGDN
jgi:aminopeptidase N